MTSIRHQALTSVRWTAIASVWVTVIQFLQLAILARYFLSPVEFGLMALVTIILAFGQFYADAGLSNALIYRQNATLDELSSIYWTTVATAALFCGALALLAPGLAWAFDQPALSMLVQVAALKLLVESFGGQFRVLLTRDLRFKLIALQDTSTSVGAFVVAIGAATYGLGVWALVLSILSGSVLMTAWLVVVGLRDYRPKLHFAWKDLHGYIGFGLFQTGQRTLSLLWQRLDQIILARLAGIEALGIYNVSVNLTTVGLRRINPIVTTVAFPLLSKLQGDIELARRGYMRMLEVLTAINAPILLGLCAVAPTALPMVLGPNWEGAVFTVQLLAGVALLKTFGNPMDALLLSGGRADIGFYWNVGMLIATSPIIAFGAYRYGAEGAAGAWLIICCTTFFPTYYCTVRPILGSCGRAYCLAVLRPTIFAGVMASAVYVIGHFLANINSAWMLFIQIGFGTVLYLTLSLIFFPHIVWMIFEFIPMFPGRDIAIRFLDKRLSKIKRSEQIEK